MLPFGTKILWRRTKDYVATYNPTLIGVTGNSWRTLTRDAIAVALHHTWRVRQPLYTRPLTRRALALDILGIKPPLRWHHWWSVLARSFVQEVEEIEPQMMPLEIIPVKPGYIPWVVKQVPFKVGVVTDIGSARLDYFTTTKNIAAQEQALISALPADGLAVLNQDDPLIVAMAGATAARVITFGRSPGADVKIERVQRVARGGLACTIMVAGQHFEVHLPYLVSLTQASAVAAAFAVAHGLDVDLKSVAQQLQALEPGPGYLGRLVGQNQATIIDGSAEATPELMLNAIEILRAWPARRKIAILGDITGLGVDTYVWHKRLGKLAGEVAHIVIGIGEQMRQGNVEAILVGADTHHFETAAPAGTWLSDFLQAGDVVLVIGSSKMRLQEVVERLK